MPEEDRDVPEGSQIPNSRIHETEEKVRDYKEKMRATSPVRQQELSPQDVSPEPKVEQP